MIETLWIQIKDLNRRRHDRLWTDDSNRSRNLQSRAWPLKDEFLKEELKGRQWRIRVFCVVSLCVSACIVLNEMIIKDFTQSVNIYESQPKPLDEPDSPLA